ncbi:hypothetical protein PSHT_06161 [Puccinia striiformis]|uniref:Uncharacterized protein n=1 Tax=Puccinia striiformis TaxID=27350 RepID=A0A2S4W8H6_9BASI|nr:hypothetical protein PSHT_06161 [Puccinia striiformis]
MKSSYDAHNLPPALTTLQHSTGPENPPRSNQHSAEWTNQVLLKILKLKVVRRAVQDAEAGQSDLKRPIQAMSQPLSSLENNSRPNEAKEAVDPDNETVFWGSPFPEFHKLDLIFGEIRATRENARSICQQGLQLNADLNTPGEAQPGDQTNPAPPSASPAAYLSRSHSKKDAIANALDGLVGFLQTSKNQSELRHQQREATTSTPSVSNLQLAMSLYQEVHAEEASQHESLAAFKVFRSDINAQIFTSIREKTSIRMASPANQRNE